MGARILVVEDAINARDALAELLREAGYTVETASHGRDGLRKVAAFVPDVLVTDLGLPSVEGVELLLHMQGPGSAAILMTNESWVPRVLKAMAGNLECLIKPIQVGALLAGIERALAWRSQHA